MGFCDRASVAKCNDCQLKDSYGNCVPEGCSSWYDGCNMCGLDNGMLRCTMKYCFQPDAPKCNDVQAGVKKSKKSKKSKSRRTRRSRGKKRAQKEKTRKSKTAR